MASKEGLNLSRDRKPRSTSGKKEPPAPKAVATAKSKSAPPKSQESMAHRPNDLLDDSDDDDDEDDEIIASVESSGSKSRMTFYIAAAVVILVVVVLFVLFIGRRGRGGSEDVPPPPVQSDASTSALEPEPVIGPSGVGVQDFSQNTTMTNSDVLTNPDKYTEDIHGLTVQVGYTAKSISRVADFVNYTKHRGTWGGGLELHWLDAEYKGAHYVVQVPFEYYKELADEGIVPVSMEVLTLEGSVPGEPLNVITFMELDVPTLKDILKQQSKVGR